MNLQLWLPQRMDKHSIHDPLGLMQKNRGLIRPLRIVRLLPTTNEFPYKSEKKTRYLAALEPLSSFISTIRAFLPRRSRKK
jgi:hypothetical protein